MVPKEVWKRFKRIWNKQASWFRGAVISELLAIILYFILPILGAMMLSIPILIIPRIISSLFGSNILDAFNSIYWLGNKGCVELDCLIILPSVWGKIIIILFYFIIGAIIGQHIGKIKFRSKNQ